MKNDIIYNNILTKCGNNNRPLVPLLRCDVVALSSKEASFGLVVVNVPAHPRTAVFPLLSIST